MAEGFMKALDPDNFIVYSAGTEEYDSPKPRALEVMTDIGIDMSHASSKLLTDIPKKLDILVTMGCGVKCPFIPTKHREDWGLDDPSGGPKKGFEETRDIIKEKVENLIERVKRGEL